ncbi:MAG: PD-(D/E)XK nuclease family protein, partial [Clostridia bacterium]|nr:PD-(D/E)XK nuclease family protein [Clostridia bacterium]
VVKRIAELVFGNDGKSVEPSDIAVLYARRSARVGMIYEKLRALGINATVSDKIRFTSVKQIGRLCKFLKFIVDERDEVALIASLKSPVANLSDEELVKIRFTNPAQKSFRVLIEEYASKYNDEIARKIREFLSYTAQCRQFSYTERAGDVIGKIVADKNWFKYIFALPDAKLNADTLNSFLEFAVNSPYGDSVKNFVEYMENDNDDYERPPSANAVKIMTIHASKGLEFEHVFLIDVSSQFSNMDASKKVICDGTLGFCMENFDESERTVGDNQLRVCAKDRITWSRKEESMRVLYVALTRPKTALYIYARVKEDDAIFTPDEYNHIDYESGNSFFDWLRPFYCRHPFSVIRGQGEDISAESSGEKIAVERPITVDSEPIRRYLDFTVESKSVAVKMSATAIMHDEAVEENIPVNYIAGATDDRAIEIGNAYHKAMELVSFNADFDSEWERIKSTFDIENLVDKEKLRRAHKVVGEFVKDKKCLKEQQFMYKNDENLLIQGIVDLLVIDQDKFIVIDYKTSKTATIESGIYDTQLRIYCDACRKILNLKPLTPLIYSFNEGRFFEGKLE